MSALENNSSNSFVFYDLSGQERQIVGEKAALLFSLLDLIDRLTKSQASLSAAWQHIEAREREFRDSFSTDPRRQMFKEDYERGLEKWDTLNKEKENIVREILELVVRIQKEV